MVNSLYEDPTDVTGGKSTIQLFIVLVKCLQSFEILECEFESDSCNE